MSTQSSINEKQKTILLRVQEELESDTNDMFHLFTELRTARNNAHPDKYPDPLKKEAEEKFIMLGGLLSEFREYISAEKLKSKSAEIMIYEEKYANLQTQEQLIDFEDKNRGLIKENSDLKKQIATLELALERSLQNDLNAAQSELISMYEPKKTEFLTLGITAFVTLISLIVTHLTAFRDKVAPLIAFDPKYLNYGLLIILFFIIVKLLLQQYKRDKIQQISEALISPDIISEFRRNHTKLKPYPFDKNLFFDEESVSEFITYKYSRSRYLKSLAYYIDSFFRIKDYKSKNHLKDIFIYNLLVKKLISIGSTKDLTRQFNIL